MFFAVLLCAAVLGALVTYVLVKHRAATTIVESVTPRYARIAGLQASGAELDVALAQSTAKLGRQAYPSAQEVSFAGSDAQQRARDVFTKAGMQISSTQVLPVKVVDGFDRIPVILRLEGDLQALQSSLVALSAQAPSLFIEGLNVQVVGVPGIDVMQRLSIQVNLFVLRVRT